MPRRRNRGRRALRPIVATCLLIAILGAAGFPVFVRPQIDPLRPADAILVLGGPDYSRYGYGFELADRGLAPNLVISNPNGGIDRRLVRQCAATHPGYRMYCFLPDPPTTKGEGRTFGRLAAENGWRTVIVVTIRPHVSRARYILGQCFDGEFVMVPSPGDISLRYWAYSYVYQTSGWIRAFVQPGC